MRKLAIQILMTLRLTLRDGVVLFFSYVFPLFLFLIFGQLPFMTELQVITMALALGAMGGGLFGVGIRATADREHNILRRFKVVPVSATVILVSGIATGLLLYLPLVAVLVVLSNQLHGVPWPPHPVGLIVVVAVSYFAFSSLGSLVASVVDSVQESQVVIQTFYFPMLFLGGVTWPISIMPAWLQGVAQFIPSTYMTDALRPILAGDQTLSEQWPSIGALALTGVLALIFADRLFRWDQEERLPRASRMWLLVALVPFVLVGVWRLLR